MMLASLAMYDFPGLRDHWQALYDPIAAAFPAAPRQLRWGEDAYAWSEPVFLSLMCGAPYRNEFSERLHLVGTFDFDVVDGSPGYYNSVMVGRIPENAILRLAVNDRESHSGYHALRHWIMDKDYRYSIQYTGAHLDSLRAVARDEADLCALDAVSYRFIAKAQPHLAVLPIVGYSLPSPGLPLVTSFPELIPKMRTILRQKLPFSALGIAGLETFTREDYLAVANAPA